MVRYRLVIIALRRQSELADIALDDMIFVDKTCEDKGSLQTFDGIRSDNETSPPGWNIVSHNSAFMWKWTNGVDQTNIPFDHTFSSPEGKK